MKKRLLFTTLLIIAINIACYSQGKFEKAYFIDNNNKRTECLIYNNDWKNNPISFRYKLDMDSDIQRETINNVKEFSLSNNIKFQRYVVDIDISSNDNGKLSSTKRAEYKRDTIFLSQLVDGEASLYRYQNANGIKYFFRMNDSECKQLIYKKYYGSQVINGILKEVIKKNIRFKQQLLNNLKNDALSARYIKSLNYKKNDLVKCFVKYNASKNADYIVSTGLENRKVFAFGVRSGIRNLSYSLKQLHSSRNNIDFGNEQNISIGFEVECILPFNNGRWSLYIEPIYQYLRSEGESARGKGVLDYKSIEIPLGLRYNYNFKKHSKIFLNIAYAKDWPINSKISIEEHNRHEDIKIYNTGIIFAGFGYAYNNKFSIEFKQAISRSQQLVIGGWTSDIMSSSIILGYNIF